MRFLDILFVVFIAAAVVQALYYLLIFSRLALYKNKQDKGKQESLSVIICARNEEDNLLQNLPLIFEQDYPEFEVVVVNDCSYDNTIDVLRAFENNYDNLKVVTIKETNMFSGGKKFAVTLGVKAAKNEHLIFTDADCNPVSKNWLKNLASGFDSESEIVLGYGKHEKTKGILNTLVRFDTFYIALQYLSFSLVGAPYMGVGRNMAYKKSLFFKNKGFASHHHIKSGDDDLFINEVANRKNTRIIVNEEASTNSKPKETLKDWFYQKKRHLTTGHRYKLQHKILLGMLTLSQFLFFVTFFILLFTLYNWQIILGVFFIRTAIQLFILNASMNKLGEKGLLPFAPVAEVLLLIIYPAILLSNVFIKQKSWTR